MNGYTAVLYLRSEGDNGQVSVKIVTAKSRIALVKTMSIPKLELCDALLKARLLKSYKGTVGSTLPNLPIFACFLGSIFGQHSPFFNFFAKDCPIVQLVSNIVSSFK